VVAGVGVAAGEISGMEAGVLGWGRWRGMRFFGILSDVDFCSVSNAV
jgi:hypothetical protein